MAILVTEKTRVVVQGITGSQGAFHTGLMKEYMDNFVVAGVTPGKGGQDLDGTPVYNSVAEAVKEQQVNTSVIFVPPPFATDAILEAVDAELDLVICITEGIPVLDMMKVKHAMKGSKTRLIGPNCPGVITPGMVRLVSCLPTFTCLVKSVSSPAQVHLPEAVDQPQKPVSVNQLVLVSVVTPSTVLSTLTLLKCSLKILTRVCSIVKSVVTLKSKLLNGFAITTTNQLLVSSPVLQRSANAWATLVRLLAATVLKSSVPPGLRYQDGSIPSDIGSIKLSSAKFDPILSPAGHRPAGLFLYNYVFKPPRQTPSDTPSIRGELRIKSILNLRNL